MERKFVRKDEQIKLIMECRQSGLSDYQWCRQRDGEVLQEKKGNYERRQGCYDVSEYFR